MNRKLIVKIIICLIVVMGTPFYANANLNCGIKPIPNIGCRVGRCVDGYWEQICDSSPTLSCGIKPIPRIGCQIGRCVDGHWEQICN